MKKQKSNASKEVPCHIDETYIEALLGAMKLHRPCVHLVEAAGRFLRMLDVRTPNDFAFEYTGYLTLRWYDGTGDHLGDSRVSISATVWEGSVSIRGCLARPRRYNDADQTQVLGLPYSEAASLLKVFVSQVDTPTVED
jgi:hypothetical protein